MQNRLSTQQRVWWFPAVALALVVALAWAPVVAAGVSAAGTAPVQADRPLVSGIEAANPASSVVPKVVTAEAAAGASLAQTVAKRTAAVPKRKPAAKPRRTSTAKARRVTRSVSRVKSPATSRIRVAKKRKSSKKTAAYTARTSPKASTKAVVKKRTSSKPPKSSGSSSSTSDELAAARAILASLISQHPILAGTTVSIGSTPGGYQAVAYFKSGRILVSPDHRASLRTILRHEIWHVIDWRDNNHIDWGESVPPR